MQRAIYFFFAVLRAMGIKENTEAGSEVGISKCVSLRVNYMFMQW